MTCFERPAEKLTREHVVEVMSSIVQSIS